MLDYPITLPTHPGPLLAFLPEPDPEQLAETAVALANTDGGAIVIGLDGDGATTGPVPEAALARTLDTLGDHCMPLIDASRREPLDTPGGPVIAVRIARSARVHALRDGRVFARTCVGNRLLDGAEIRRLISARTTGDFEAQVVPGATPADLDPALLADFLLHRAQRTGTPSGGNPYDLLVRLGMITPEYGVTVAGMLLFGRDPARWLPDCGVTLRRFVGAPSPDGSGRPAVEQPFDGPLAHVLDAVWDAIRAQMRRPALPGSAPDEEYPPDAVREALVNAVTHRDYRLRGDRVAVCLYPDRLEITSPGGLPGFMSTAQLIDGRLSRNPRLAWSLYHWGYVEAPGDGIRTIMERCAAYQLPPLHIDAAQYSVTVRLYKAPQAHPDPQPSGDAAGRALNARQQRALDYIAQHGSLTLREFQSLCDAGSATLQQDLAQLVDCGRLRKVGSRLTPYYIMD